MLVALALPALEPPPATAGKKGDRYRKAMRKEVNRVRAHYGLPRVSGDRRLNRAARSHSKAMARSRSLSHGSWATRVRASSGGARAIGEVIGWLQPAHPRAEAARMVRSWLGSPPHRAILLSGSFRRIGIGRATRRGAALYTADFASRR